MGGDPSYFETLPGAPDGVTTPTVELKFFPEVKAQFFARLQLLMPA